jgi:hypothetical protein
MYTGTLRVCHAGDSLSEQRASRPIEFQMIEALNR